MPKDVTNINELQKAMEGVDHSLVAMSELSKDIRTNLNCIAVLKDGIARMENNGTTLSSFARAHVGYPSQGGGAEYQFKVEKLPELVHARIKMHQAMIDYLVEVNGVLYTKLQAIKEGI